MVAMMRANGRIGGPRLATMLGPWRRAPDRPAAVDLAAAVRLLVLDGRLAPGTRLPSERELAAATGTSRTLTTAAYDHLRGEGLLASRQGSGSWTTLPGTERGPWHPPADDGLVDLAYASPPAPPGLAAAADAARCAFAGHLGGHGYHPHGLPELRRLLADRYTARGLPTTPDEIVVTHGAQHALSLVLHTLTAPGDRVLVEHPTYPNALDAIRGVHARPVPVALDPVPAGPDGWDLDGIEAALSRSRPALAYLVPEFHNPTGLRMPAGTRAAVAGLLRRSHTPVVVDESLVELDLDGGPAPVPFAAHAGDLAVTIGSASKTFWGGLRLGWLRAPAELVGRLVVARPVTDLGCPVFEQLVLAELLAGPPGLLAPRLAELRVQRAALLAALARHLPGWSARVPGGGLSLWCALDGAGSSRLAGLAPQHGLRVMPGARFSAHGGLERWLRLPYTLPPDALDDAVGRLALAWDAVGGTRDGAALDVAGASVA